MAIHYVDHIAEIKSKVSCFDAARHYGFEPNKAGYICCPFHHEKTPSLKLWNDHFKCFGCGCYGDVIAFVRKYKNCDFPEAMNELNREFQLGLPLDGEKVTLKEIRARERERQKQKRAVQSKRDNEIHAQAVLEAYKILDDYIRAFPVPDNPETARAYRLRDWCAYELDNIYKGEQTDDNDRGLRSG